VVSWPLCLDEPIKWVRWGDFYTTNRAVWAWEEIPPPPWEDNVMGIEDRILEIESKLSKRMLDVERELNKKMPDKVHSGGWGEDGPVSVPVNRILDLILEKLDVQIIHTPQGFEFGPRPKDKE